MYSKTMIEIICILSIFAIGHTHAQTSHGETADPEVKLKPRNFNPHPFEAVDVAESRSIVVPSGKEVRLVDENVLQDISSHLFRRQSPNVFNKGPIQFPNNNDVRPVPQQPRFYLKATNLRTPTSTQKQANNNHQDDYDEDYDQRGDSSSLSKKHYAFSYVVRDHHSGDDFSHSQQQQKDGGVSGSYKVQLPDGRTQVVKYTADHDGYKADVTYIENEVTDDTPRSHVYQVAPTASRPKYFPLRPTPTQLSFERLSGGYELPKHDHQSTKYAIPYPQSFASTPRPFVVHPSPAPSSAYVVQPPPNQPQIHSNYVDLQNVEIETYQTAPHHYTHKPQPHSQQSVSSGRIVFPTSPTIYNDIHVLPSPKPYPYATTVPLTGKISPKSTSIVASPPSYAAQYQPATPVRPSGTIPPPEGLFYLASRYISQGYQPQLQQPLSRQQFYVATVPHSGLARRNADQSSSRAGPSLGIRPDQALYYKQK